MYQTSCRRKKPSRWKSINTHTHTQTHTTAAINSAKETRERNQRVLKKCFSTVYFMARNKWVVKNMFEEVMNHICNLGDTDLINENTT